MANPVRGEVDLPIGETTYRLKISRNAIASAEGVLGLPWSEIISARGSVAVARGLVWAALQRHHPKVTLLDVGDLLDELNDDELVGRKIGEAIKSAFGGSEKAVADNPQ